MKNITLTANEKLIEEARKKAYRESTTLNNRFREWLQRYVAETDKVDEYRSLMHKLNYVDAGRKFSRDEMNERR